MPFLTPLEVKLLRDDAAGSWELLAALVYEDRQGRQYIAPQGFQTDFCTVPRLPLMYARLGNKVRLSGVIHDQLYTAKTTSRAEADQLLREMIVEEGQPQHIAFMFWLAVRLFGGTHWR